MLHRGTDIKFMVSVSVSVSLSVSLPLSDINNGNRYKKIQIGIGQILIFVPDNQYLYL